MPLAGSVGDSIEVVVADSSGNIALRTGAVAAASRPPVVVRTQPPAKKTDVPLNAVMLIVFSEPVNPGTVTTATIRLQTDTQLIAGAVSLLSGGLYATFTPDAPLAAQTEYVLRITTGVSDAAGLHLAQPFESSFRTGVVISAGPGQVAFIRGSVIHLVDGDGSGLTQVPYDASGEEYPVWSPDGAELAFTSGRDGHPEIYRMGADGSSLTRLTFDPAGSSSPAWAPVGAKIAFQSARTGPEAQIYAMDADGSGVTQLTTAGGTSPAWSPDGSRIAFLRDGDGIYVMNSDGTGTVRVKAGLGIRGLAWSPDGSRIAFIWGGSLLVMNSDGSSLTGVVAADTLGSGAGTLSSQGWSPDGRKIAFGFYWCGEPDPYLSCATDVAVVGVDGTNLRSLTTGGVSMEPAWRPTR